MSNCTSLLSQTGVTRLQISVSTLRKGVDGRAVSTVLRTVGLASTKLRSAVTGPPGPQGNSVIQWAEKAW